MKLPVEGDNWHQVIRSDKLKLGKKKMRNIGLKSIMLLRQESTVHATDALCRHAWVGQWKEAIDCNIAAVEADDRYVEITGNESQFYKFYRMHNHHFVVWCAMFDGQYETALKYARKAVETLPAGDANSGVQFMLAGVIPMGAIFLESYVTMPWHVMIRFGKWNEILNEPLHTDRDVFPAAIATQHYARGVAYASMGMVPMIEEWNMHCCMWKVFQNQ